MQLVYCSDINNLVEANCLKRVKIKALPSAARNIKQASHGCRRLFFLLSYYVAGQFHPSHLLNGKKKNIINLFFSSRHEM